MQSMMNLRRATTASSPLRTLGVRYMSGKDVRFGDEARAKMLAGVDKLADAVQVRRGDALLFILNESLSQMHPQLCLSFLARRVDLHLFQYPSLTIFIPLAMPPYLLPPLLLLLAAAIR